MHTEPWEHLESPCAGGFCWVQVLLGAGSASCLSQDRQHLWIPNKLQDASL